MTKTQISNWIPEVLYEENSQIPFINVPRNESDPAMLFIFVNRETGEYEPGSRGEKVPVFETQLKQFADMSILAEKLSSEDYDKVRKALGLEDRASAAKKGRQITRNVATRLNADVN